VSDYFRAELLHRLPPLEAGFLKYTSVLERISGGLCDRTPHDMSSSVADRTFVALDGSSSKSPP
jgi:hypothetical protein